MNTKSDFITSGEATSENITFEILGRHKNLYFIENINLFNALNLQYYISFQCESHHDRETTFSWPFCVKLEAFSVFTWYDIGCKPSLQLNKNPCYNALINKSVEIF